MSASGTSARLASNGLPSHEPCTTSPSLLGQVKAQGVMRVGQALGLLAGPSHSLSPCPACGAAQRGSQDRRGPIGVRRDDTGWHCHRCHVQGDAVSLVACCVTRKTKLDTAGWRAVIEVCRKAGLCSVNGGPLPPKAAPSLLMPHRPPEHGVQRFWSNCVRVTDDHEVVHWLGKRGLDAGIVEDRDLVRVLPANALCPRWARFCGGPWEHSTPWTETSHRVIFPLWGPTGTMETVHARAVHPLDVKGRDKAASPAGYQVSGTVMADVTARALLKGGPPRWWRTRDVFIVEGAPDFLTWATRFGDAAEGAPAILGVIAGSWSEAIASRIPSNCRVLVMTHDDQAGEKYAAAIINSLLGRCAVYRGGK